MQTIHIEMTSNLGDELGAARAEGDTRNQQKRWFLSGKRIQINEIKQHLKN